MPNAKYHAFTGILAGVSTSIIAALFMERITASLMEASIGAAISLLFTFAGSMAPDVDHHNSYVFRFVKATLVLIGGFTILTLQYYGWNLIQGFSQFLLNYLYLGGLKPDQVSIILCVISFMVFTGSILEIIELVRPTHRGPTHTVWVNMVFASLMFPVMYFVFRETVLESEPALYAAIASVSWVIGATIHKLADSL